tara:strand:+ start:563 stop:1063 length:501 start_codon:yes stop_codon:yes gene_type:complete
MWIVAKIKNNNIEIFKKEFSKKFINDEVFFYQPEFIREINTNGKKLEKKYSLLENYIFCKSNKFEKIDLKSLQYVKGLNFILSGHAYSQENINEFIKFCKSHEDKNGYIQNSFFKLCICTKGKFISGPFQNMIFDIIKKNRKNLKISIGNFLFTVSDKVKHIYRPV